MELLEILRTLANATGVSGLEQAGAVQAAALLLEPFGVTQTTPMGSVICTVQAPKEGQPHLMLNAHLDQIGMVVTHIDSRGFLKIANVGGIDRRLVMASQVTVHGTQDLKGIICSTPPHLQSGEAASPKLEEIAIDIGMSKEKAEQFVAAGDRVSFDNDLQTLRGDFVTGRSLDDRAGCAAVIWAAQLLQGKELPCGLTLLLSGGEETGGTGARVAAYQIAPTHAIVVDVSFAHTPDCKKEQCGQIGKGAMVGFSPILHHQTSKELMALGKTLDIPVQPEVMGGKTGTDADGIVNTRQGVMTALLSIPEKYMHTPIETVSLADIEAVGKLMAAYAQNLGGQQA